MECVYSSLRRRILWSISKPLKGHWSHGLRLLVRTERTELGLNLPPIVHARACVCACVKALDTVFGAKAVRVHVPFTHRWARARVDTHTVQTQLTVEALLYSEWDTRAPDVLLNNQTQHMKERGVGCWSFFKIRFHLLIIFFSGGHWYRIDEPCWTEGSSLKSMGCLWNRFRRGTFSTERLRESARARVVCEWQKESEGGRGGGKK